MAASKSEGANGKIIKIQQATILGTRVIFHTKTGAFNTIWTSSESGQYKGSIVRGDNSTSTESFSTDCSSAFGELKYGETKFKPSIAPSLSTIGVFGRSTDMKNFDATPTTGQLGSAND